MWKETREESMIGEKTAREEKRNTREKLTQLGCLEHLFGRLRSMHGNDYSHQAFPGLDLGYVDKTFT